MRDSLYLAIVAAIAAGACGSSETTSNSGGSDAAAASDAAKDAASDAPFDSGAADAATSDADRDASFPTVRRPFLVGASLRAASGVARADWAGEAFADASGVDATTARFLARAWAKDALEEHASVAAFARFSLQLLALGAPPELVIASQRASLDEIEHARACFALAARYGSKANGPGALALAGAFEAHSLADVAALCAEEGCVGETLGAALARDQLAGCKDPQVAALLARLVRDEARHAELAWRFAAWAVARGGRDVLVAIETAAEHAIAATLAAKERTYDGVDLEALRAHGRLPCAEAKASARRTIDHIIRPALRDLAALTPSAIPHAPLAGA